MTIHIDRESIRSMGTDALKVFIEIKTAERNDLWGAALDLNTQAQVFKQQGNYVNWELAVAAREMAKRGND